MQGSIQYIWNQSTYWNCTVKAVSLLYIQMNVRYNKVVSLFTRNWFNTCYEFYVTYFLESVCFRIGYVYKTFVFDFVWKMEIFFIQTNLAIPYTT